MTDPMIVTAVLAIATISIRLLGIAVGQSLPQTGAWARALKSLPGCLIVALVAVMLLSKGSLEWIAAVLALGVAVLTRSLPLTMVAGILAVWSMRHFGGGL